MEKKRTADEQSFSFFHELSSFCFSFMIVHLAISVSQYDYACSAFPLRESFGFTIQPMNPLDSLVGFYVFRCYLDS